MYLAPHLFESAAEPVKDPLHVATLLHGDDAGVVLLIDPDEERLLVVVPEVTEVKGQRTVRRGEEKVWQMIGLLCVNQVKH